MMLIVFLVPLGLFLILAAFVIVVYGRLWLEAFTCGADVRMVDLIGMSLRGVSPRMIVTAKIMGKQAGLSIDRESGMSTHCLEAHFLARGDVMKVVRASIAARHARLPLSLDLAMAIDLAGRDITDSIRTSVSPKIIQCPEQTESGQQSISGVSIDGIELFVRARVTVRTNLNQLIGGATEQTIIARVGQGIISAIGSTDSFRTILQTPSLISQNVLARGLDANSSYEIVSTDIVHVSVGNNIGAALSIAQAEADMRTSKASAESRLSMALARAQEMVALIAERRAELVLAEAGVPIAIAAAFALGNLHEAPNSTHSQIFPKIWHSLSEGA